MTLVAAADAGPGVPGALGGTVSTPNAACMSAPTCIRLLCVAEYFLDGGGLSGEFSLPSLIPLGLLIH